MKIIKISEVPTEQRSHQGIFMGTPTFQKIVSESVGAKDNLLNIATFPAGARSRWHIHTHDQIVYPLSGKGIFANEEEEQIVTPGSVVFSPGGEKHWHGAAEDSPITYLYVLPIKQKTKFWDPDGSVTDLTP